MKYGNLTLGQIEAIVNKLGGMDGVNRLLADEFVMMLNGAKIPVWKTIRLGPGTGLITPDCFRGAIRQAKCDIDRWADDILKNIIAGKKDIELDLCVLTTSELVGKQNRTIEEVFFGASRLGLERCPAEVGPQLRLQYLDQPRRERLIIGMDPIRISNDYFHVLSVEYYGSVPCLYSRFCALDAPDILWDGDCHWVFVRPRKKYVIVVESSEASGRTTYSK